MILLQRFQCHRAHLRRRLCTSAVTSFAIVALVSCDPRSSTDRSTDEHEIDSLQATVSAEVGTVVTVQWRTRQPTVSYLEYGDTPQMGRTTRPSATPAFEHSAHLVGFPASTNVFFRPVWGEGASHGDVRTTTTGGLPRTLPKLRATGSSLERYVVTTLLGGETKGPVILGPYGNYVWFYPEERDLDVFRARLSRDGKGVYYNAASVSGDPAEDSELVWVSFDGAERRALKIPLLAHDFVELEDGTLTAIVSEYRPGADSEEPVRGEKLVELSADGSQRVVWSSWDCFDPQTSPGDEPALGWTFANALDYDAALDAYYVGLRNFSAIASIDRVSGACNWVFGQTAATIRPDEASAIFVHQHQFDVADGTLVVFDNSGASGLGARVLEYAFDPVNGVATEIWSYMADPPRYSMVLGDVSRLDNGDRFVVWSVAGQMERVTQEKEVRWQLNTEIGHAFGFATPVHAL